MGITKDYLRFAYAGRCNIVGSQNGMVQAVDKVHCAVIAGEAVSIYNTRTMEKSAEIRRHAKEVTAFKFSKNSKQLAVGYADGEVHLYHRNKNDYGEPIVFTGHKTSVNCLEFSHDGLTLAVGGRDTVITLWDVLSETGLFRLGGHKATVTQLQFTLDDKFLISSSKDSQVKFWDLGCQACFHTLAESITEVYTFSLLKQDRLLFVGTANMELEVYEITWLEKQDNVGAEKENEPVSKKPTLVGNEAFTVEPDQGSDIIKGSDTVIDVFRIYTEDEGRKRLRKKINQAKKDTSEHKPSEAEISRDLSLLSAHIGTIETAHKVKWADFFAHSKVEGDTKTFRLFTLLKNNTVHGLLVDVDFKRNVVQSEAVVNLDQRGHRTDVRALAVSSNNAAFLSASSESAILWDMSTLMPVNRFTDPSLKDVTAALFLPGDRQILLGTKDGSLFLFDVPTCELMDSFKKVHDGAIFGLNSLPGDHGFVSASADKKALFWRYSVVTEFERKRLTFRQERTLELPDEILCMCISPNHKFIAFGLLDNTARVYFLDKLKFFVSLYGHSLPITAIDIGPDSKLIATGSADKSVKIWGLDFGDCHRSLFAHDDTVTSVKFNKDVEEQLLWSTGKDGLLKQWNAKKFDKVQTLEGHFGEIRALASTSDGSTLITAAHDKSIRLWELTEEIIMPAEEEEKEREKEDLEKIVDAEDIIPGENPENELNMAAKKNVNSVKGAETILEAVEIYRSELVYESDAKHRLHTLVEAYGSPSLSHFILDAISRISSTHLERSLMLVPFDYVIDIFNALIKCVKAKYRLELATRVITFLFKINLNQLTAQKDLYPFILQLQSQLPKVVAGMMKTVNFNLAGLKLHKLAIEERDQCRIFKNVSAPSKKKKRAAVVKPVVN